MNLIMSTFVLENQSISDYFRVAYLTKTSTRSQVIGFPAGDYRRGPEAAGVYTTQDIAAGRSACLSTEGLRGSIRTGHHYTHQLVTADRKVPSTLQISAGAAATEEGGARQVVASQLQADI